MKSERRHENETNWLASHLAVWIEKSKPYIMPALIAVAVAVVAIVGFRFMAQQEANQRAEAWNAFFVASTGVDESKLTTDVSQKFPGSDAAQWASMAVADQQLTNGMRSLFFNQKSANELLESAGGTYLQLERSGNQEMIRQRAAFSRATALEAQSKIEEAKKAYAKVTGANEEEAKTRIKSLEEKGNVAFYEWFATAKTMQFPTMPGPGTPGMRPDFNPDPLSGESGDFLPGFGLTPGGSTDGDTPEDDEVPSSDTPSADAPAAADSTPEASTDSPTSPDAKASDAETAAPDATKSDAP